MPIADLAGRHDPSRRASLMAKRQPRVAVGGIVIERHPEGPRVLLVRRAQPPQQGRWSLPGGRVEAGERLAEALVRELQEETGIVVRVGPLVEVVEVIEPLYHYVILDYACDPIGGTLRPGSDAGAAAMVAVKELSGMGVTEAVLRVVEKALELED